jgi:hypothetical protein
MSEHTHAIPALVPQDKPGFVSPLISGPSHTTGVFQHAHICAEWRLRSEAAAETSTKTSTETNSCTNACTVTDTSTKATAKWSTADTDSYQKDHQESGSRARRQTGASSR